MTYGRSLGRYVKHADLAHADSSALCLLRLALDRAGWCKLVTASFNIGMPHARELDSAFGSLKAILSVHAYFSMIRIKIEGVGSSRRLAHFILAQEIHQHERTLSD
eukprot:CAMPEP_0171935686 /NCGR_PEP_ID=MMETSP0993-20121228/33151_1 /TAXON_ID=483369 /ORGANISM="non described non described, Strain CCMP2098" /LENGTH=105 /DNA_ID=CAMNT_0012576673 /DNA_START=202 /DNA_END=517 /DNA_ORIENTATION=-